MYKPIKTNMLCKICLIAALFLFSTQLVYSDIQNSFNYNEIQDLLAENKTKEAKELLSRYISKNKQDYQAISALAAIYLQDGDKKSALKWLNKGIAINESYLNNRFLRGKTYFLFNKFDESAAEFAIYIDLIGDPKGFSAQEKDVRIRELFSIFDISFSVKSYEIAKDALKKILEMDEKDASAMYNLGVYYYKVKNNRSKAYELFSKASAIDPASEIAKKSKYAIEFMRANPDSRVEPDFSFINSD